MPVTAKDIAEKLGLSQPTVSRILNGTIGYRAAPETRERVMEEARRMGYRPNAVARSLRHRRTNIVGFYTGYGYLNARNAYLASLLGGLQEACDEQRLDILLHGVYRGRSTSDIYGELVDGRIDGLFLHTTSDDPLVGQLAESSLPVVALSDSVPELPCVVADDVGGIRKVVRHLADKGHRRLAFLAPSQKFISVERRVAGFVAEIESLGLPRAAIFRTEFEEAGPAQDLVRAMAEPATAVCCWNDTSAVNLLARCRADRVRVPDDLAVTGFDGAVDSRVMAQPLTTVSVPWTVLGRKALEILRAEISGHEVERESVVPVHLTIGDTT